MGSRSTKCVCNLQIKVFEPNKKEQNLEGAFPTLSFWLSKYLQPFEHSTIPWQSPNPHKLNSAMTGTYP